jgi:hypothetical protein
MDAERFGYFTSTLFPELKRYKAEMHDLLVPRSCIALFDVKLGSLVEKNSIGLSITWQGHSQIFVRLEIL